MALPRPRSFLTTIVSAKGKLIAAGIGLLMLAVAAAAIYYVAYNKGSNRADVEISEYEKKIEELNRERLEKDVQIRERVINNYHTRVIERTRVQVVNQGVIRDRVPEQHKLSEGWVYAHDQSAKGEVIDPAIASNPAPSEVSDRGALLLIDENYDIARGNKQKLDALQDYVRQTYGPQNIDTDSSEPAGR